MMEEKKVGKKWRGVDENSFLSFQPVLSIRK
jgi:hypothetical protein